MGKTAKNHELIQQFRDILLRRREALRQALAGDYSLLRELRQHVSGDLFDFASDTASGELNSQLAEFESRELTQIDEALERIASGSYGVCDDCNKEIPLKRLQALPYATECIDCKRRNEQGTNPGWRGGGFPSFGYNHSDSF